MDADAAAIAIPSPRTRRPFSALRAVLSLSLWLTAGFALALTAVVALPPMFGHRTLTVISGSMEPALETGSVVIDKVIAPADARPSDVVTFNDPARRKQVTHRLQSMRIEDGMAHMVTKGDANDAVERWSVPTSAEIGRVEFHVPKLGHVRALISTREVRLGLVGGVMLLGLLLLWDVWRPKERGQ